MADKQTIVLKPVAMTGETMTQLERLGLISRLVPGKHQLQPQPGETLVRTVYEGDPRYGPHKLISVTVNNPQCANFGSHPDNEDFLMLGDPESGPLYLIIALCLQDQLAAKLRARLVTAADFIALTIKYNDPEVSFFTMLKDVPHGECLGGGSAKPASFYVTEPRDLGCDLNDFGDYRLQIGE